MHFRLGGASYAPVQSLTETQHQGGHYPRLFRRLGVPGRIMVWIKLCEASAKISDQPSLRRLLPSLRSLFVLFDGLFGYDQPDGLGALVGTFGVIVEQPIYSDDAVTLTGLNPKRGTIGEIRGYPFPKLFWGHEGAFTERSNLLD